MSLIRGKVFYYLVLFIGMGLIGTYFWLIVSSDIPDRTIKTLLFLSGFSLVLSTFALAGMTKRRSRIIFTIISGLSGGIHGYLDIIIFQENLWGALLFGWISFGLLLAFAALAWLPETDYSTSESGS
ncbi:hypothetical protein EU527_09385 [Candidatus Thorarchaeota archaeon]|nr:MAG: hypothetical protein EU527_09385 [Candidatus Thorarchaeota archaeon]